MREIPGSDCQTDNRNCLSQSNEVMTEILCGKFKKKLLE